MSAEEARPRYMGRDHVARMNALLAGRLLEECAALDRDRSVHYEVSGDPDGIRTWTVTVGPDGMRFALDEHVDDPVLLVRGSYGSLAAAAAQTRASRGALAPTPDHDMRDPEGFAVVARVVEAGRAIATVDVRFPDAEGELATDR